MKLLAATGSLLIILTVATGWLIVAKRYLALAPAVRMIRDDGRLVKGHMEFPVMALLVFLFYLLKMDLPFFLVLAACTGAVTNPSLQLFLSIWPDADRRPTAPFGIASALSFLVTTLGFGGIAAVALYEILA